MTSQPPQVRAVSTVALALVAIGGSLVVSMAYLSIIDALPRPMQGESVSIPWSVCWVGYWVFPTLLSWLVALPFLRHRGLRRYFLFCLLAAALVWYFAFGFGSLLDKAYRRGL